MPLFRRRRDRAAAEPEPETTVAPAAPGSDDQPAADSSTTVADSAPGIAEPIATEPAVAEQAVADQAVAEPALPDQAAAEPAVDEQDRTDSPPAESAVADPDTAALTPAGEEAPPPAGPVDVSALAPEDRESRLDLGALLVAAGDDALEGLEVQLQADENTGDVLAVLVLDGTEAAVELRAFAAPKRSGLWHEVRDEIAQGAQGAGGQTADALGPWGIELLVQMPVQLPDGQQAVQVSRIVGVDGPRWFLRATFLGRAAVEPQTAGRLHRVLEQLAVVRGEGPMAPRDAIALVVPGQVAGQPLGPPEGGREPLQPFERGPEITEVR